MGIQRPSGAAACFFKTTDGRGGETFTVNGPARVSVEAWQPVPGLAELRIVDADGEELSLVLAWVDDPHMYPVYPLTAVGPLASYSDYRIGAIAVEVEVFDDVEEWKKTQTPIDTSGSKLHDLCDDVPSEMYIGPEFVTSPWLFSLYGGEVAAEEASPISMFKAVCKEIEVVTNQLTGMQWYRVQADCGIPVTLALPITTSPTPKVGSVVDGKAFLTGTTGYWNDDFQGSYD